MPTTFVQGSGPTPPGARRVVVETCLATTLDRLGLPRRNYKRPQGKTLTPKEKRTRRKILSGLRARVAFSEHRRRVMAEDPGGDALDAALAAFGAAVAFAEADHAAVAEHPRYKLEGRHFA